MTIKTAAGSQPAVGTSHVRNSNSTQSAEKNMTSQTNARNPSDTAYADFALVSKLSVDLAAQLGLELVSFPSGFGVCWDGDVLSEDLSPSQLEQWLCGYESGKDDLAIVNQLDQAEVLLAELVKAEQIIQTMMAAMSDTQKQAVANSVVVVGAGGKQSACRSAERQAAIVAARADGNGSAA